MYIEFVKCTNQVPTPLPYLNQALQIWIWSPGDGWTPKPDHGELKGLWEYLGMEIGRLTLEGWTVLVSANDLHRL